ncbi:MAG TPA: beta-ketoacyl synthase chain length factor [Rhodopila sp.]|uniref:beta-ketoacyl synthase chain length factor n=1 Tax=Rhodopila sp. TaxID=2480087 RepID=UPI002C5304F5|nr:beta-ketoacyl synthase chain length factor [Rhodopila sp.]HVY16327.1 beta-ketoacyl synthase chain length factor [Rhodopila sp.]
MSAPLVVGLEAAALCGPGLPDWAASLPVLTGATPYRPEPLMLAPPPQLSPGERRRAVPSVRLALGVGMAAVEQSGLDAAALPAVFASSSADGETIDAILATLCTATREVSPTRFHNSVHNAPSGYWGLATQSREVVSSVSCHDQSFAAGLLEAAVQVASGESHVLLVAYDLPYPPPLAALRPIVGGFGVALVLSRTASQRTLARLRIGLSDTGDETPCADPALDTLRLGNPAARALPLLIALGRKSAQSVRLGLSRGGLQVDVEP